MLYILVLIPILSLFVAYRSIKTKVWIVRRSIPGSIVTNDDYLVYLRFLKAYEFAANKIPKGSNVLEIGCWNGYGSAVIARKVGMITAIDKEIDQREGGKSVIAEAKENYGNLCDFKHAVIEDMPSNNYDYVICFQVIEHIKDDSAFLKEIARVLKDNGTTFISTTNHDFRLRPDEKIWNKDHMREYTPKSFSQLIESIFPNTEFYGVFGNKKATKLEKKRINDIKNHKNLRRVVKTIFGFKKSAYSTDFFSIRSGHLINSIDLIAVSKKI